MKLNVFTNISNIDEKLLNNENIFEIIFKLPRDTAGGQLPTYFLPAFTFSRDEMQKIVSRIHRNHKKAVYSMNAVCLGNLEYVRKNYQELVALLDVLHEVKVDGIRVASPFLVDLIKKRSYSFNIICENIENFTNAKFYNDLGIRKIGLSANANRNFRLLNEIKAKLDVEVELVANDMGLLNSDLQNNILMSYGHGSQSCHQNEGFMLEYYYVRSLQHKLNNISEFVKSPWIRPEDLDIYERSGVSSVKILGQNSRNGWLPEVVNAYDNKMFEGNLLDLLNVYRKTKKEPLNKMIIERPDHAHSKRTGLICDIMEDLELEINNRSLEDFILPIKNGSIDCQYCHDCGHCQTFADLSISVNKNWLDTANARMENYLNTILCGSMFEEEENFKIKQIVWGDEIKDLFEKMIVAKPEFVHEIAREGISKKAEELARTRGSNEIAESDIVKANLSETPSPFTNETIKQMKGIGIDVDKYLEAKSETNDNKQTDEKKSDEPANYSNGDEAWEIITKFLTAVNNEPDKDKFIPKGTPVKILYKMPDIDFSYYETIGEGEIKYTRGDLKKPDVTLTLDSGTYHEIMAGIIHPVQASESKRSKVDGPVFKLIKIQNILTRINQIYPKIYEEYISTKKTIDKPTKTDTTAVSDDVSSISFKDRDHAWGIITEFLTAVNNEPDKDKFIPKGTPVKILYKMPDIDFSYVETIGEGKIDFTKGDIKNPDVTLTLDSGTYHDIMAGIIHPVQASESKRSKVDGPVFKLIKIQNILTRINQIYPDIAKKHLN